ncbi:MAG: chromate transporter [Lachnospiraceae bacterium]|nr:chromate transporter [Lachnospiraceae bacterium]
MNKYLDLFLTFARIGGFTFGGGYAMLPMITRECVDKKKWATEEEVMDYFAIGQCTPGVIAVNTATFVGGKIAGPLGGFVATIGVIFPSWVIITIIALFIQNFAQYEVVQHALAGITVAVFALVVNAVLKLGKKSVVNVMGLIICLTVFVLSAIVKVPAAWLILLSGVFGLIYTKISNKNAFKSRDEVRDTDQNEKEENVEKEDE